MNPNTDVLKMSRFKLYAIGLAAIGGSAALAATVVTRSETESGMPGIDTIQLAYDSESTAGNEKHDKNLKIVESRCHQRQPHAYSCFVSFTSSLDPDSRLYFDVAEVTEDAGQWRLKSGICKH